MRLSSSVAHPVADLIPGMLLEALRREIPTSKQPLVRRAVADLKKQPKSTMNFPTARSVQSAKLLPWICCHPVQSMPLLK